MSTPAGGRKTLDAARAALGRTLGRGRGGGSAAPGHGLAAPIRSLGRGGWSAPRPTTGGVSKGATTVASSIDGSCGGGFPISASMDGFPFPPSTFDGSCGGGYPSSSTWCNAAGGDSSYPGSWDKDVRPPGGFMSYFENDARNSHLVGAAIHDSPFNDGSSPTQVEQLHGNDNVRTEKRIMWTVEEDVRVMSAWI